MIVIKVELLSAVTGETTELARMHISNTGNGDPHHDRYDYHAQVFRGRDKAALDRLSVHKEATIGNWPRSQRHVWNLVAVALRSMGYGL